MIQTNKVQKAVIYGGSFDPLHLGHIDIVNNLSKKFDKVIIVPSAISPFKLNAVPAPDKLRLKMLKDVFKGNDKVTVSDYEIKNGSISYSYLTVKFFKKKFKDLSFCIGSEEVEFLDKWKNVDELKKDVVFYIVNRPEFALKDSTVSKLKKDKIKFKVAPFKGLAISSAMIKLDLSFDKPNTSMPDAIYSVVKNEGLYSEYSQIVQCFSDFNMTQKRIDHTYRAVVAGLKLAKINSVSSDKTITALLLHDIGKYTDAESLREHGWEVPDYAKDLHDKVRHSVFSKVIAKNFFDITDEEILEAIEFHTTAKPDMSELGKVVFLADYIEDGRDFDKIQSIREIAFNDLNLGVEAALNNTLEYLEANNEQIDPVSKSAYEYYKKLNQKSAPVAAKQVKSAAVKAFESSGAKKFNDNVSSQPVGQNEVMTQVEAKSDREYGVNSPSEFAHTIAAYLDDKKARNITLINLANKTIIADYFVIASATSSTQVKALIDYLDEKLSKTHGIEPIRRDVDKLWSAIDYGSVIVHVFYEETRNYYGLERLWSDGTNVEKYNA